MHGPSREPAPLAAPVADEPCAAAAGGTHARPLDQRIRDRVASRLGARVRRLHVRLDGDEIVLQGECSTYYSKQLAQHAALALVEDETLRNEIVVVTPC